MTEIRIITESGNIPAYETAGSAGMDLRAVTDEPVVLKPGKRALIGTGLRIELPQGYEAQIRARSGLAIKYGICLINGIGTVDSDYRGEIRVALVNLGEEDFEIRNGDRIAQMVIMKYEKVTWKVADDLSETQRGEGGFGHTGV